MLPIFHVMSEVEIASIASALASWAAVGIAVSQMRSSDKRHREEIAKLRSEQKEASRRKIEDAIQRLYPTVYSRLLKWALGNRKQLMIPLQDQFFHALPVNYAGGIQPPPDLSEEPDFAVITGDHLKDSVSSVGLLFDDFYKPFRKAQTEYRDRLNQVLNKYKPEWNIDSVIIVGTGSFRQGLLSFLFQYGLVDAKDMISRGKPIRLEIGSPPTDSMDCPEDLLKALQVPDDLASFKEAESAKIRLQRRSELLITELKDAVINGEKDWHIYS